MTSVDVKRSQPLTLFMQKTKAADAHVKSNHLSALVRTMPRESPAAESFAVCNTLELKRSRRGGTGKGKGREGMKRKGM